MSIPFVLFIQTFNYQYPVHSQIAIIKAFIWMSFLEALKESSWVCAFRHDQTLAHKSVGFAPLTWTFIVLVVDHLTGFPHKSTRWHLWYQMWLMLQCSLMKHSLYISSVLDSQGIDSTVNTNGAGEHSLRSDVIMLFKSIFMMSFKQFWFLSA